MMRKDAISTDPDDSAKGGLSPRDKPADEGTAANSNWDMVREEYRRVVQALNRRAVSFTSRSAEGITLYGGLDSHKANGNMRKLAKTGQIELLRRIEDPKQPEAASDAPEQQTGKPS
jgi:hypothetical protein